MSKTMAMIERVMDSEKKRKFAGLIAVRLSTATLERVLDELQDWMGADGDVVNIAFLTELGERGKENLEDGQGKLSQ